MNLSQCSHIRRLTLCIKNFVSSRKSRSNTDNNKMAAPNNSDSNRSTISRVRSPRDVQRVVEGLNLPFRHFSNKIPTQRKVRKLEKKHALLFTGKALRTFFSRHCECKERVGVRAVLRFKTIVWPFYFHKDDPCTVASLTKIINDSIRGEVNTCSVCYEEARHGMNRMCTDCCFKWCSLCEFKLLFDTVTGDFRSGITFKCPQCTKSMTCSLHNLYVVLLDQMDKLTEKQKTVISLLQQVDPEPQSRLKRWNEQKRIKPRSIVRVCELQSNLELNGKIGGIIGKSSKTKNGIKRWPVHLNGTKRIIMVKEENLSVLCDYDRESVLHGYPMIC